MEDRRNYIVDGLRPVSGSRDGSLDLAERILRMFYAWPTVRLDEDKALGVAQTYAEQVQSFPMWAIAAAIAECQGRKIPFPPSAGELRAACQAKVQPYNDELAGLRRVLEAEIYTATKHDKGAIAKVNEMAAKWKSNLAPRPRVVQAAPAVDARDEGERDAPIKKFEPPSYDKPVTASPALLKTLRR